MAAPLGTTSRVFDRARPAQRPAAASSEPRAAIGPWQLTALLHRGRRLSLFRATPAASEPSPGCYALKTFAATGDRRLAHALLRREAAVAESVQHAHLASVLAAQTNGEVPYVVLPLLDGVTIDVALSSPSGKSLPIAYALWIVRQIAAALDALHNAGWLHGQVAPKHILVSPQGHATLLDLSQCRQIGSDEMFTQAQRPDEPMYASPEVFSEHARLSPASDFYCLGVVLFELLAGQPPFATADARQLAALHRGAAVPDIRLLRPDVTHELATLLRLLLTKEPLRRPPGEQLLRWLAELEIGALC